MGGMMGTGWFARGVSAGHVSKRLSVVVAIALLAVAAPTSAFGALDGLVAGRANAAQAPEWSAHKIDSEGGACVFFLNAAEGWAGDPEGYLFHTRDGGVTWTRSRMPQSKSSKWQWGSVDQIQFVNKTHGWVLMGGGYKSKGYWYNASRLYRTTDGGATWKRLWTRKGSVAEFQFVSASRGWFVQGRTVYRTTNGGARLTNQHADRALKAPKKFAKLTGLRFVDARTGWACGGYIGGWTKPILLRTRDGGKTWKRAKTGLTGGVDDVWFVNRSTGYAIAKGLYKTTNAGKSWRRVKYSSKQGYDAVQGFGTKGVRLLGNKPRVTPGPSNVTDVIWTSRDGAATWSSVDLVGGSSMSFVDIDTGWLAGAWVDLGDEYDPDTHYCILRTPGIAP